MTNDQKIQELSLLQQNIANITNQKQQFVSQSMEMDAALQELKKTDNAYKIIGNVMVSTKKEDLIANIKEKKEILSIKIKSFEKQENKLKEKAELMQKDIVKNLENSE